MKYFVYQQNNKYIFPYRQRQKFRTTLAQLESGPSEEDLLFGMSGLGLQPGDRYDMTRNIKCCD